MRRGLLETVGGVLCIIMMLAAFAGLVNGEDAVTSFCIGMSILLWMVFTHE
jgi:hypothetical protein